MSERAGVPIRLRPGRAADAEPLLALWDEAIVWMVERGQSEQWGAEPASTRPRNRALVTEWTEGPGLTIAESVDARAVLGVSVVTDVHPEYVPPIDRPELYLLLLLVSRRHRGHGIGAQLIRHAAAQASEAGVQVLRVDCWAGAPTLVAYYERQGFLRAGTFSQDGWRGQIFEMPLAARPPQIPN